MTMDNLATYQEAHRAFNRRDFAAAAAIMRNDATYVDHPRNLTVKGPAEFADWMKAWQAAFSDAEVTEPRYIDGGSEIVAVFQGRGTQDGPVGPFPASGNRMDLPFCEILRFDAEGRVTGGEIFYDSATMLVQLGHIEPMPAG